MAPHHRQSHLAGQILDWCSTDDQATYQDHLDRPKKLKKLQENNWIDCGLTYRFNSHGFRTDEFDSTQSRFLVLGCSFTFGEGLHQEQIWCELVAKSLDLPCWNLGVYGSSNSSMFRLAEYWIPRLKPKFVILQKTYENRFEILYESGRAETYTPNSTNHANAAEILKDWWSFDENSQIDARKNELAIRQICANYHIPIVVIEQTMFWPQLDLSRDLLHAGPKTHERVSKKLLSQGVLPK